MTQLENNYHLSISTYQCDQIGRNFATSAKLQKSLTIFASLFSIWQNIKHTLVNYLTFWANFVVDNGQILNKWYSHPVTLVSIQISLLIWAERATFSVSLLKAVLKSFQLEYSQDTSVNKYTGSQRPPPQPRLCPVWRCCSLFAQGPTPLFESWTRRRKLFYLICPNWRPENGQKKETFE